MNRRRLLALMATSTITHAGCNSISGEETNRVSTSSEVRKQPTGDHPPEIGFSLTNESDDPITVLANNMEPFVWFPRLTGDSGAIVLLPISNNNVGAFPNVSSTKTKGCWRFVDTDGNEAAIGGDDGIFRLTLQPGVTHHVTHRLYYEGAASDCFPDGDYTADHTVEFDDAEATVTFSVQVSVSDGRISGVEVQR